MKILAKVLKKGKHGPGRGLFWVTQHREYQKLSEPVRALLTLEDTSWVPGCDADEFFEQLCSSPGIGLGLPNYLRSPKELAKRLEEILPEKARGPWRELQSADFSRPAPAVDEVAPELAGEVTAQSVRPEGVSVAAEVARLLDQATELWKEGRNEDALALCERAVTAAQHHAPGYLRWGAVLAALGRDEEATQKYQRATEIDPSYASAFNNWGNALASLRRHEEAFEKYQRVTEIDRKLAMAFNNWGNALRSLGRHEDAVEKYRRATEIDPNYAAALNNSGNALSSLGRREEALEKYQRATEIDPKFARAFSNWGNALRGLGRNEEAIEKYQHAAEIDPKLALPIRGWSNALKSLGRTAEAEEKLPRYRALLAERGKA